MSREATRFGVLINPTAGLGRGRKEGGKVLAELERRGFPIVNLTDDDPAQSVRNATRRREEYDALIVVGGDGMAHMGINLVAGTTTPLGLVPAGTGNDFARHLGMPIHRAAESVDLILDALERGPQLLDALKITEGGDGEWNTGVYPQQHRWAGCVVSAGFDSMVNKRANSYTWPRGLLRYIRGVLRELPAFHPYPYRIEVDGQEQQFRGTLVAVANSPSFGGGMKIAPPARADSGELLAVIATEVSRPGLLRVFPKVYSGSHTHHPAVSLHRGSSILIQAQRGERIPPIFADGEYVADGPVRIDVVAGALQMLCPKLGA